MINWTEFKRLLGNGRTKLVSCNVRGHQRQMEFVSYNDETKQVTLVKDKNSRTLHVLELFDFQCDYDFIEELNEKPLFSH